MPESILIAGFDGFPGAPVNPTAELVGRLAAGGAAAATMVLPVEWERTWPVLAGRLEAERPDTVLLFGLHKRVERLRLETCAHNRRELGRSDAAGAFPAGPAVMDGPETLPAALPWGAIAAALHAGGIDFEFSTDAGSYLCNDTLYRLVFHAAALGVRRYGFVHVPLSDEGVAATLEGGAVPPVFCSMPAEALERAALAIAEACRAPA